MQYIFVGKKIFINFFFVKVSPYDEVIGWILAAKANHFSIRLITFFMFSLATLVFINDAKPRRIAFTTQLFHAPV